MGFIGAGVIVRGAAEGSVHGLTTAAVVWLGAGFGILCGIGAWSVLVPAVALVFLLLRPFVLQTYHIPSGSMYPTLRVGDHLVVQINAGVDDRDNDADARWTHD